MVTAGKWHCKYGKFSILSTRKLFILCSVIKKSRNASRALRLMNSDLVRLRDNSNLSATVTHRVSFLFYLMNNKDKITSFKNA